ncbi:hypothetical protein ACQHIV_03860 [Kribbella sp. GL6]|uniref:hypothetical protein n=1 Tax=Kribbella sp. GL6 TaxID=3419765 RepID=UPI003D04846C
MSILIASLTSLATPAHAATALPGGRPNYVISVFGGGLNAFFGRTAQYTFTAGAGSTGTVTEKFWYWDMATFTGDASVNKVLTGYSTTGCPTTCTVKTPVGFQPSGTGSSLSGTYYFDINGRLVINWSGGQFETWTLTNYSTYTAMSLYNSNMDLRRGHGYGSTASFSTGVSRDALKNRVLNLDEIAAYYCSSGNCPTSNNGYAFTHTSYVDFNLYDACTTSPCLQLHDTTAWRSMWVIDPASVGRRVYWQHQNQGVDGVTGPCFSNGGGHTWALQQAIADDGTFIAMIGIEASLNARVDNNAVISEVVLS